MPMHHIFGRQYKYGMFIRDYNDDEATVIMVDTNIQREDILPSEKARAYAIYFTDRQAYKSHWRQKSCNQCVHAC